MIKKHVHCGILVAASRPESTRIGLEISQKYCVPVYTSTIVWYCFHFSKIYLAFLENIPDFLFLRLILEKKINYFADLQNIAGNIVGSHAKLYFCRKGNPGEPYYAGIYHYR